MKIMFRNTFIALYRKTNNRRSQAEQKPNRIPYIRIATLIEIEYNNISLHMDTYKLLIL